MADAYVNQQNKYRYLSIDCSGIGGVEQIYLYETVLEDDFRQEEPARITYYSETDQWEINFKGDEVASAEALHDMISQYMDGYEKQEICYRYLEKSFPRDILMMDSGLWGYINGKGDVVIDCRFCAANDFSEGFAAVRIGDKWGFADNYGKMVTAFRFDAVRDFHESYAAVSQKGKWGFIDSEGHGRKVLNGDGAYMKMLKYRLSVLAILGIFLAVGISMYLTRIPRDMKVYGRIADYTYYDRKLSVSDFEQFDHDSTYEDIVDRIGTENGTIGSGIARPYYELKDGSFVILNRTFERSSLVVVNDKCREYYILPPELEQKSDRIKSREMETARQSEMNGILWMLGLQELEIKDFIDGSSQGKNAPLGEYTTDLLQQYTDRDITAEISYYFGNYRERGAQPLIQIFWLYEGSEPAGFGYVLWDTDTYWYIFYGWDQEPEEAGEDCTAGAEQYELKGLREILNLENRSTELDTIDLSPEKIANSLTDFLIEQKVIKNKRNSCVEFWGENGDGEYVCLISANPWERGEMIGADSRATKYYFVSMDTWADKVVSIRVMLLDRS